jgi:hypothetical protein
MQTYSFIKLRVGTSMKVFSPLTAGELLRYIEEINEQRQKFSSKTSPTSKALEAYTADLLSVCSFYLKMLGKHEMFQCHCGYNANEAIHRAQIALLVNKKPHLI